MALEIEDTEIIGRNNNYGNIYRYTPRHQFTGTIFCTVTFIRRVAFQFRLCSSLPSQLPRIYRFTAALIVADLISQLRLGLEGVVAVVIARRRRRSNGRFKINISSRRLHQILWQTSDLGTFRVNSSLAK